MAKFRMDADQKRYFSTLCAVGNITPRRHANCTCRARAFRKA